MWIVIDFFERVSSQTQAPKHAFMLRPELFVLVCEAVVHVGGHADGGRLLFWGFLADNLRLHRARGRESRHHGLRLEADQRFAKQWVVDAARALCEDIAAGVLEPAEVDEEKFRSCLYVPEVRDPDLLVRTAGEMRISNFIIWELAYTEIYVTEVLWPDFRRQNLADAIREFQTRERRFGSIQEE